MMPAERVLVRHEAHLDAGNASFVREWIYTCDHTLLVPASMVPAQPDGSDLLVITDVSMMGMWQAASDSNAEPFSFVCEKRALKCKREAAPQPPRASLPPSICWMAARASGLGIDDLRSKSRQISHSTTKMKAPRIHWSTWLGKPYEDSMTR